MGEYKRKLPEHDFKCPVYPQPEQGDYDEQEDQREASTLLSFVVISLCIGVACGWAGILTGRI
jgi:hypothetical protein